MLSLLLLQKFFYYDISSYFFSKNIVNHNLIGVDSHPFEVISYIDLSYTALGLSVGGKFHSILIICKMSGRPFETHAVEVL
jgi:hypothetical protein